MNFRISQIFSFNVSLFSGTAVAFLVEVALSSLPSLVLSLPLSPRDDLQQAGATSSQGDLD